MSNRLAWSAGRVGFHSKGNCKPPSRAVAHSVRSSVGGLGVRFNSRCGSSLHYRSPPWGIAQAMMAVVIAAVKAKQAKTEL